MSEEIKETPTGELEQGDFKIKKKPKKLVPKSETTKVDLSKNEKPIEDKVEDKVEEVKEDKTVVQEVEKPVEEKTEEPVATITEITEEEVKQEEEIIEDIKEETKENPQLELPENIEKLVDFMKETGGTVEDYVRLNADYSSLSEEALLNEYYKNTRPHLEPEEVKFLMEDKFNYDEDIDEERDIRKKKLAKKEEIAKAKSFLEETKSKYYEEIKLRPGVTQEQKKATEFFNRYNKEQSNAKARHDQFKNNTKDYFTKDFKGFDFNIGEKKFRYGIQDTDAVAEDQSNLTNFVKTFLDEKGAVKDYKGYHKAIYAAKNADTIANHFYEQGKADAVKDVMAKSKNITNEPRATASGDVYINGLRVKAINGVDSSKLKIKSKK